MVNLLDLGEGDDGKSEHRYHYNFIHGVFGNFFKDVLDYFDYLYPRFDYKIVSTYDKAIEYINKESKLGRENDKPNLPALILNPTGEFGTADQSGKMLHRFPNLAPGANKRIYDPIYKDSHMLITPGFSRLKGDIELIMLFDSFYEYADVRLFLIQVFGGLDRPIYPRYFNSYIIIPEELKNYTYTNEYEGISYKINWESAGAYSKLIKSTNQTELVLPLVVKPLLTLTSLSDGSDRYGGSDNLADWRLLANVSYEVEFPTFMILESDYLLENIDFNFRFSSAFSEFDTEIPINQTKIKTSWDFDIDSTSHTEVSDINYDTTSEIEFNKEMVLSNRYVHIVTEEEASSEENVSIQLSETVEDKDYLILNSINGTMNFGDHYELSGNDIIVIKIDVVTLTKDQIIEIYIYEDV